MSATNVKGPGGKKPASAATNLMAGGGAGMMEALVCHPLGTIDNRGLNESMLNWYRHHQSPYAVVEAS